MFILQAPHPSLQTTTFLPNPLFGDSVASVNTFDTKRSMNGTKYTYVKSRDSRKRLLWTFSISHEKALELQDFIDTYSGENILVTDHVGKIYIGNITSNPIEFESTARRANSPGLNTQCQFQLEFQGFEQ